MTETTAPTETTTLVDIHLAAYASRPRHRRTDLLGQVWADGGQLLDPPFDGTGITAIADLADAVLQHYPAHTFRRTTALDEHHTFGRYGWELVGPDGAVAVAGTDVVEVVDGRIVRVVGFFGDLVPA
ncbi:nuclear transport factor 2 family protein [Aquihabitans daechungensis]|uniref:nuclear transport factor 2 family protein n=1 Tax=Aquihabitans daechungensis TaxID=1052257 RepID=UPI003BA22CDB